MVNTDVDIIEEVESNSTSSSANQQKDRNDSEDYDYASDDSTVNLNNVKYVTKNKQMSYFGSSAQDASVSDIKKMADKIQAHTIARNKGGEMPPGYYDYEIYKHRESAYKLADDANGGDSDRILRIGDCFFVIPPEFITVSTSSTHDSVQGLRHSGSVQIKHGYSVKEIQVSLVLNGMNQINGYEVNSPFDYKYFVDGLRTLIAQFKYTPFLPIQNNVINLIHGVHMVALRNIAVETVQGFPETLNVTLSMQEFNVESYTGIPACVFEDCIDWDLFRFYTQRQLRKDLKKISTNNLTGKFEFKLLKDDVLTDYKLNEDGDIELDSSGNPIILNFRDDDINIDITKNEYYSTVISDKDNLKMTAFSFSMGNIMPVIQLSAHESPTMQFLGATDTSFVFNFETTDQSIAALFNEMNRKNQEIVRDHREKSGIGFIKIENELANLIGVNFLLLENIRVSTVPGFAGLYEINMECLSYDSNQNEKEKLIGMKPFAKNGDKEGIGTKDDLIHQEADGVANKIRQDAMIEKRIMELEMYPDLHLPTYKEVDEALSKIKKYRVKIGTANMPVVDKYPRSSYVNPGSPRKTEYSKYVDPDFYVFYPSKLSDIAGDGNTSNETLKLYSGMDVKNISNASKNLSDAQVSAILKSSQGKFLDMYSYPEVVPDKVVEPEYAYGYEPEVATKLHRTFLLKDQKKDTSSNDDSYSQGTGTGKGGDPTKDPMSVSKVTGNPFVDLIIDRANSKCGYVYGTDGQIYSDALKVQKEMQFGWAEYNGENQTSQWLGKQVFDCSGVICWAMRKIGAAGTGFRIGSGHFGAYGSSVSPSNVQVGDIFYNSVHCGVYIGDGKTVEALNSKLGVAFSTFKPSSYNIVRLSDLPNTNSRFLSSNPNFYSGGSGSTSTSTSTSAGTGSTSNGENGAVLANFGIKEVDQWNDVILKNSKLFNLDPNFIKTIIRIESNGNPNAVSFYDPPNIVGLMQIYLKYHRDKFRGSNPFDPDDNIYVGCKIFLSYGGGWVNYDLEKWITAYNAGPGAAEEVFIGRTRPVPAESAKYIEKYKTYYSELLAKGASPGSTITPTVGGMTPSSTGSSQGATEWTYNYTNEDFKNPNANTTHGNSRTAVNVTNFGESFIRKISDGGKKKFKFDSVKISKELVKINDPEHVVEYMFHDSVKYSYKGSLARAFPSFLFMICDEQSDWIDRKKLWTNYYVYRSVLDIDIHEACDNPIHTAKVTLTNFHNNLSEIPRSLTTSELLDEGLVKKIYDLTGALIDEQITDKMLEIKNKLKKEISLHEGARIHIRLGYGSNPGRYPTSFNGTITNIEHGELVTLVAQSDGIELVSRPLTDKTTATNKDISLPEETSNMIARMLTARESEFLYAISFGNLKINSKNGIEHFGSYCESLNPFDEYQYDINKNVYKGTYDGVPFCKQNLGPFDGESNWRFFAAGKNVWDITKMCEKSMPEFVSYPRYFGFESRFFYGLPSWLCNYKYEVDSNGDLYEYAKSFAQVHDACSLDSIIENKISIDTRGLATNMIGIYTLGGDMASTPVIMSDHKIDWGRQKTRTIDTTSVQDFAWSPFGIIEKLLSWSGSFDNGKQLAIKVCVSELCTSWRETYSGSILLLGRPEISVYDWVYLDDIALHMTGMMTVREVVHSMSVSSGFTTSITPGMMVFNTLKQSGLTNVNKGVLKVAKTLACMSAGVLFSGKMFSAVKTAYAASKNLKYIVGATVKVANFTATNGKTLWNSFKTAKTVTQAAKFAKDVDKVADAVRGVKKFYTIVKSTGAVASKAAGAAVGAIPGGFIAIAAWLVIDFLLGFIITAITDMFAYKNTVILEPLLLHMPDRTVKAYVGGVRGGKKILPMLESSQD